MAARSRSLPFWPRCLNVRAPLCIVSSLSLTPQCTREKESLLTFETGRYGYSTTHRAPTWMELNMMNVVIQPIAGEAEAARALASPKSWVIMHRLFG